MLVVIQAVVILLKFVPRRFKNSQRRDADCLGEVDDQRFRFRGMSSLATDLHCCSFLRASPIRPIRQLVIRRRRDWLHCCASDQASLPTPIPGVTSQPRKKGEMLRWIAWTLELAVVVAAAVVSSMTPGRVRSGVTVDLERQRAGHAV